jgi:hypothetical protein
VWFHPLSDPKLTLDDPPAGAVARGIRRQIMGCSAPGQRLGPRCPRTRTTARRSWRSVLPNRRLTRRPAHQRPAASPLRQADRRRQARTRRLAPRSPPGCPVPDARRENGLGTSGLIDTVIPWPTLVVALLVFGAAELHPVTGSVLWVEWIPRLTSYAGRSRDRRGGENSRRSR